MYGSVNMKKSLKFTEFKSLGEYSKFKVLRRIKLCKNCYVLNKYMNAGFKLKQFKNFNNLNRTIQSSRTTQPYTQMLIWLIVLPRQWAYLIINVTCHMCHVLPACRP